jgi:AcrR family transcriptional regulator
LPRPELHSADSILDAARELVLTGGARAATVNRLVEASGAPKGSIYHRFGTLDELLAALWLRTVRRSQAAFVAALEEPDAVEAAVAAALSLHDFARDHPADGRLLAAVRREDLVHTASGDELRQVNARLPEVMGDLARRLYGRATRAAVERVMCAVVDLPLGAVRRHLIAGSPLPTTLRPQLEAAVRAALNPEGGPS